MQESSPYDVPVHDSPSPVPLHRPGVLRIFGWLNVTGAVLGLGMTAVAFLIYLRLGVMIVETGGGDIPESQGNSQIFETSRTTFQVIWINGCITVIPAFVAGVKLLGGRSSSLGWANFHASLSLALKALLPVTLVLGTGRSGMFDPATSATCITALLLPLWIYPALSLILLNRPKVRAWFAEQKKAMQIAGSPEPEVPASTAP